MVAKSHKHYKGCRPSPLDHSIKIFADASYKGFSEVCSLIASLFKGLWSDRDKKATHKHSRVEGGFSGPEKVQGPVPNQTVLVATDNATVVACIT